MQASLFLFETNRLIIRRIARGDAQSMHSVYGDSDAMRWVGDGKPLDLAQCREWIEVTDRNYTLRGYGMFALILKETGGVVGFCGLVHPYGQPEPEIKYSLHRNFWGKGYATEAVTGLLAYAASHLGIHHAIATVAPENIASQRVLTKSGMCKGELRRNDDHSHTQFFLWNFFPEESKNPMMSLSKAQ